MHRLIVIILAAVDAAIAAAVGIAATLAPLTLLWVLGMGGTADWGTLWPASAAVWQLGNLVPLQVTLPGDYLAASGIEQGAASFVLSLAPLAFASFTAIFAARSGVRASRADAWATGVVTGAVVFALLATLIAATTGNPIAEAQQWQAILLPALVFAVPLLVGAVVTEWREADSGVIARVRDRIEAVPFGWGEAAGLIVRGTAVVLVGLIGLGALVLAAALVLRGGEVIALFEAAHVDVLGAIVVTLAQLAYLPTLVIWGFAFVAGPGFAVGAGTAVSPAGTQLGVIPGIPVLGALPESTTPWLLLLALLPVALGAFAGWIARSRLASPPDGAAAAARTVPADRGDSPAAGTDAAPDDARTAALTALLAGVDATPHADATPTADGGSLTQDRIEDYPSSAAGDPIGARLVIAVGIAVLSATGAALLALLASGSIGPGRLAEVGPQPGPLALVVGAEVLIGAAILLLSPRRRVRKAPDRESEPDAATPDPVVTPFWPSMPIEAPVEDLESAAPKARAAAAAEVEDVEATESITADPAPVARPATSSRPPADPDSTPTVDLGPRRPRPLPPVD